MKRWINLLAIAAALLCALPAQAGDDGKIAQLGRKARALAERLQAALDPDQCRSYTSCRVTMAVGILDDGKILIASSEEGRRIRSPIKSIADEEDAEIVFGAGHAELRILAFPVTSLFYRDRRVLVVAAGRPICKPCEESILKAGARPASACESGRRY